MAFIDETKQKLERLKELSLNNFIEGKELTNEELLFVKDKCLDMKKQIHELQHKNEEYQKFFKMLSNLLPESFSMNTLIY